MEASPRINCLVRANNPTPSSLYSLLPPVYKLTYAHSCYNLLIRIFLVKETVAGIEFVAL